MPPFKRQGATTLCVFPSTLRGWAPYRQPDGTGSKHSTQTEHATVLKCGLSRAPTASQPPAALLMHVRALSFTLWWPPMCLPWLVSGSTLTSSSLDFHPSPQLPLCIYWSFPSHIHSSCLWTPLPLLPSKEGMIFPSLSSLCTFLNLPDAHLSIESHPCFPRIRVFYLLIWLMLL